MQDFWRLTSLLIALIGFIITGGWLLTKGELLPMVIVKSVLAFAVLYVAQNYIGAILSSVIGGPSFPTASAQTKVETPPAEEKK